MAPSCSNAIAVQCIPGFTGQILTPSSALYQPANQRFSATAVLQPAFIARPATDSDISRILQFALGQDPKLELAVKGGGVNPYPAASSDGGLVIDLSLMNTVSVSGDKQTVTVGGGAKWGDVYAEADKQGVAVVGGSVHLVGVGGSALAGGYSPLSGQYGMAVDNMLSATVVLADGRVVKTDATNEPDLFWAIRGGVNQFGVVTQMVFATHPSPGPITMGSLVYPSSDLPEVLQALHDHLAHQDPSSKMILMFARSPDPSILILPYIENQKTDPDTVLAPFRTLATPVFEGVGTVNNFSTVAHGADSSLGGPPRVTIDGALFSDVWDDTVTSVYQSWEQFSNDSRFQSTIVMWEFSHPAKIASKPVDSTAFAARSPHFYMTATARNTDPADDAQVAEWTSQVAKSVRQAQVQKTGNALPIPASLAQSPQTETVEDVFGSNLPKLRTVKAKYDPGKVWSKGWVIEPDFSS
ncbi:hypothetical protein E1B28_009392 [Marasmius oreades]|uniref:FAD-binding PCMH-type domain-containing protein n=1 Tax=Marasmius oreades TaxID=181124 RepID=A0A9P7UUA1_9AGAR|nr:uncharacterized protein E1B28_009392 [Marasmius oreades]KAG7093106.1 hypothetical protein E1B28_009392 [Marasmius oreades]